LGTGSSSTSCPISRSVSESALTGVIT
jgi:hypothetical protein